MSSPNKTRRLTARFQIDTHSGYGFMTAHTFYELQKMGIYVSVRAVGIDQQFGAMVPKEMIAQRVIPPQPEPFELLIYPCTLPGTPGRRTIHWTMWESSTLSTQIVSILNRCDSVIVPSEWGRKTFKASGVRVPTYRVPLGFDPEVFRPAPLAEKGPTIFGIAGRVAHCPKRKMIQEAIDLFLRTFNHGEDVRLHVKIHPDDKIKDVTDRRVKIFREVMEPYQLANWLHGLTAYLTLARAEGFGLWPLQALACGRPVIGCKYSGQADFLAPENSFLIGYKEAPVDGVGDSNVEYQGLWADPNLNNAACVLKTIHADRTSALEKSQQAAESVKDWTWTESARKLVKVLEQRGVWKR